MNNSTYDEEKELDRYILDYYGNFMTHLERSGQKSSLADEKAQSTDSPIMAKKLIDKWGSKNNPDVVKALSEGSEVFRKKVRKRIMKDHSSEIFINRCSKCNNIVKTPRAQMCLWCNFSWHKDS